MNKIKISVLVLLAFFPFVSLASSSLTLSPPAGSIKAGQTFKVTIFADPNGGALDTVRAKINFPQESLEVQNFSLNSSFSYQSGGNDLGNQTGQFSWGSGIAGGISQSSVFGTLVFKAKKEGRAIISVSPDSLVLSAGENSFDGNSSSAVYQILPALVTPPTPQKTKPAENKAKQPDVATSTMEDSFLGQTAGPESQESIFPSQTADLSSDFIPFVEDSENGNSEPLFSRINKVILGVMFAVLLLIGWGIYRLKDTEVKIR